MATDDVIQAAAPKLAQEKTGHRATYEGETRFLRLGNSPSL